MWSPGSNNRAAARFAVTRAGSPALAAFALLALLAGCHSGRREPERPLAPVPVPPPPAVSAPAPAGAAGNAAANASPAAQSAAGAATAAVPVHPEVPPAAQADFARAVGYMRAGNATEAELGFKQFALEYPQFAAPLANLGIMYRKAGRLEDSERALKSAVEHEPASAVAWSELGVTQRMRGEFKDAAASYEQAISADPQFAPAYRNLAVVSDLYLADPGRALVALTHYQELTHEEKPVGSWIAELRQRLGLPPVKRPEATPEAPATTPAGTTPTGAEPKGAAATPGAGV